MEVHFYQLQNSALAKVTHDLAARCLQHGWQVNVVAPNAVDQMDGALWAVEECGFFPHGVAGAPYADQQTVLISNAPDHSNNPDALILTGLSELKTEDLNGYQRVSVVFDGNNLDELQNARSIWKNLVGGDTIAKYWSQENGSWKMKASSDAE
ncbi:MAG: DNA polymerase III subunit chi [Pseudomonadota bacterium]